MCGLHLEMREDDFEIIDPPIKRVATNPRPIGFASAAIVPIDHLKVFGQEVHHIVKLIVQQPESAAEHQWFSVALDAIPQFDALIIYMGHEAPPFGDSSQ